MRSLLLKRSVTLQSNGRRCFCAGRHSRASSPLFQLGALSFSREGQYLSKATGIPRIEFHPSLELIKSSEVDPFDRKRTETRDDTDASQRDNPHVSTYEKSVALGNALLEKYERERIQAQAALEEAESKVYMAQQDLIRAQRERGQATIFAVLAILVAAGVASYKFSPETTKYPLKMERPAGGLAEFGALARTLAPRHDIREGQFAPADDSTSFRPSTSLSDKHKSNVSPTPKDLLPSEANTTALSQSSKPKAGAYADKPWWKSLYWS